MSRQESTPGTYEPRGCLPRVFHGIARWFTQQHEPLPDLSTTPWHYEAGYDVDLGSIGTIRVPPRYERRYQGANITVEEFRVSRDASEVIFRDDGSILRSERQIEIDSQPNVAETAMLRRLLNRRN